MPRINILCNIRSKKPSKKISDKICWDNNMTLYWEKQIQKMFMVGGKLLF